MNRMKYKNFKHLPHHHQIAETLKATTLASGHRFYAVDGHRYPSVTTVTGHAMEEFFAEWRRKNPKEMARVLDRGNKLHSFIEDYLNNKEPQQKDTEPFIWQLFTQIKGELDKIDNIHAQEAPLYSHLLQLAGRVDCVAEYDGVFSIIDFKGSTKDKRKEDIENYFQQATAYAIMWQELYNRKIDQIVILVATDTGAVQVFKESPVNYVKSLKETIDNYCDSMMELIDGNTQQTKINKHKSI